MQQIKNQHFEQKKKDSCKENITEEVNSFNHINVEKEIPLDEDLCKERGKFTKLQTTEEDKNDDLSVTLGDNSNVNAANLPGNGRISGPSVIGATKLTNKIVTVVNVNGVGRNSDIDLIRCSKLAMQNIVHWKYFSCFV